MEDKKSCSEVIQQSGVKFGTSGARGLVSNFSFELCTAFTQAFLTSLACPKSDKLLYIGIDNRPSSPELASYCISTAKKMGFNVVYCGVLPTPALAFFAMHNNAPSIMVTGSHIPFDRNGLKFYTREGEITKSDELAITDSNEPVMSVELQPLPERQHKAISTYIERYLSLFKGQPLAGKKIGVYEHSSAGRDYYSDLLAKLGANVISLDRSDEFISIDTEAVSEQDIKKAQAWVAEHNFDAIFSTDGDGDRPLIADELGNWLPGDIVGLLSCQALGIEAVATPISCNTAIEASGILKQVARTKIGSPYVIAEFDKLLAKFEKVAGFEANGGFLLASECDYNGVAISSLPTRDALLPFILLLAESTARGVPISGLVAPLPERYKASDRLQDVAASKSMQLLEKLLNQSDECSKLLGIDTDIVNFDTTDGLRMTQSNGDILHLRPSGNAPELRIYIEASSAVHAEQLLIETKTAVSKVLNR